MMLRPGATEELQDHLVEFWHIPSDEDLEKLQEPENWNRLSEEDQRFYSEVIATRKMEKSSPPPYKMRFIDLNANQA